MLPSPLLSGMNDVYENNPSSFSQDVVVSTAGKKSHHAEKNERKEASNNNRVHFSLLACK